MSTAGIYNYHPKVEHPNKIFSQMESQSQQPSFYFGGSQVELYEQNNIHGDGLKTHHSKVFIKIKNEPKTRVKRI